VEFVFGVAQMQHSTYLVRLNSHPNGVYQMPIPAIIAVIAPTLLEKSAEILGKKVLGRWSDYRTRRFVEQFVTEVSQDVGNDEAAVSQRLSEIVEDDSKSAALFDAFRHVMLSASREVGPRVIALHMAEVVSGKIEDPETSEIILMVAASMLDFEFEAFASYAADIKMEEMSFADSMDHTHVVVFDTAELDSNWRSRETTGPIPLRSELGSWAQKFQNAGLIVQEVTEEEIPYDADPDLHVDEPGIARYIQRNIEFREGASHLLRLSRRVLRAVQSA
jgi:hypothetical protein